MLKFVGGVFLILTLGACAGRPPQLIPVALASDQVLSCDEIQTEARLNNDRISELATEETLKLGQNVVAGVAGFMIWPAWLALDLQDAAGKDARALSQRNEYLATLAQDRCGPDIETAGLPLAPTIPATLTANAEVTSGLVSY